MKRKIYSELLRWKQTREPQELAILLQRALQFEGRTKGREHIVADGLDNKLVAKSIMQIYNKIQNRNK